MPELWTKVSLHRIRVLRSEWPDSDRGLRGHLSGGSAKVYNDSMPHDPAWLLPSPLAGAWPVTGSWEDPRLLKAVERLSARDKAYLEEYFLLHRDQADIGELYNVTQGAVSHALESAVGRLMYWARMPNEPTKEILQKLLGPELARCVDSWRRHAGNQSHAGHELKMGQTYLRHRILRSMKILKWQLMARQLPYDKLVDCVHALRWMRYVWKYGRYIHIHIVPESHKGGRKTHHHQSAYHRRERHFTANVSRRKVHMVVDNALY